MAENGGSIQWDERKLTLSLFLQKAQKYRVCGERCYKTSWKLLIVEKLTLEARGVDKVKVKEVRRSLEWTPKGEEAVGNMIYWFRAGLDWDGMEW